MARNNMGLPSGSILTEPIDPLQGYRHAPLPATPKAPSLNKKEEAKLAQKLEQNYMMEETRRVIDELRGQPWWQEASYQRKYEILDQYENQVWPEYAKQRFGQDTTAANRFKNGILQPLRREAEEQEAAATGFPAMMSNFYASMQKGLDAAIDQGYTIPLLADAMSKTEGADLRESADALARELSQSAANEVQRRSENAQRLNDYRREQELRAADPDSWVVFRRMYEDRSLRPLLNLVLEQWPNVLTSIGAAGGGATVGSVGGPVGSAVGAATGAAAAGAIQSATGVVAQVAQEIFDAPTEKLSRVPQYQALAAQGMSDADIRAVMARDAAAAALPIASGIGAASGILGPEALIARSSVLAPLIRGGIIRRLGSGVALGAAEEFPSEYAEQVSQNYAYNAATGDARPLTEGALEAGVTGAAVGGFLGGIGGLRGGDADSGPVTPPPGRGTRTPEPEGTVGGFNVPEPSQAPALPGGVVNQKYTPEQAARESEITAALAGVSEEMDRIDASEAPVSIADLTPMFENMRRAEAAGLDIERLEPVFVRLQGYLNRNPMVTVNAVNAYTDWKMNNTGRPVTPLTPVNPTPAPVQTEPRVEPTVKPTVEPVGTPVEPTVSPVPEAPRPTVPVSSTADFNALVNRAREVMRDIASSQPPASWTSEYGLSFYDKTEELLSLLARAYQIAPDERMRASVQSVIDNVDANLSQLSGQDIKNRFDQWKKVEHDRLLRTNAGTATEAGAGGVATNRQTAAAQPADGAGVVAGSPQDVVGAGGATQGAGAGGAAYANPGTVVGNVQPNQPVGRQTGDGTDWRRDSRPDDTAGTGQAVGNGGYPSTTEQRSSDGRFTGVLGRLAESGDSVESTTSILEQFRRDRQQYYKSSGYSDAEALRQADMDMATANTINAFLQDIRNSAESMDAFNDLQHLLDRFRKELKRDEQSANTAAVLVYRMLNTLAQVSQKTVRQMLDEITLLPNTRSENQRGSFVAERIYDPNYNLANRAVRVRPDADVNTILHEFEHYFIYEGVLVLSRMSQAEIQSNPMASQLLADLKTLAQYAGVPEANFFNPPTWGSRAHESITTAFERYMMDGTVPKNSGLQPIFERVKEFILRWYVQVREVIDQYLRYSSFRQLKKDSVAYELRNDIYNAVLPVEVRDAFDRQLTGLNTPVNDIIDALRLDVDLQTRVALDVQFTNVMTSMMQAGYDPRAAYTFAADYIRDAVGMQTASPRKQINLEQDNALDTSIDYAAQTMEMADAAPDSLYNNAINEAMVDPQDMTSPLATLGNTPTYVTQQLVSGLLTPQADTSVNGMQNGNMLDSTSDVVRGAETASEPPVIRTPEEIAAEKIELGDAINAELSEGMAPGDAGETANPDGTFDVNEYAPLGDVEEDGLARAAELVSTIARENAESLRKGKEMEAYRRKGFIETAYSPEWRAGRWASFATSIRRNFVDGGADFRLYCLKHLSNSRTNPDETPLLQSFNTLQNRITGAARLFMNNVYEPIMKWANENAYDIDGKSVDVDKFMSDMGRYRTAQHTLEAAPKQQIELERAVQEAYMLPNGQDKIDAVKAAKSALSAYLARQAGEDVDVNLYGGRTVAEAQAEIAEVVARYGQEKCDAGLAMLGNGYSWVTRFLFENGQLSDADFARFDEWLYYCAMTTDKQAGTGGINDISYYAPRQNFHRYGSRTPAQDAWTALVQYGTRASRSVGMSEFGSYLRQAYLMFEKQGNVTSEAGNTKFYNGMAMVPENIVNGIRYGTGQHTKQAEQWARNVEDSTDVVIRVLDVDESGQSVIQAYRVMFDDPKVHESVRNPFYAAAPDKVLSTLATVTRSYACVYTRFKPYFPVLTSVRDFTERVSYLPTRNFTNERGENVPGARIACQMVGFALNPMNFIRLARYWSTGTSGNAYIDRMMQDFKASGVDSSSNYNELLRLNKRRTATDVRAVIPNSLKKLGSGTIGKAINTITEWGNFFYALPTFAQFIKMRENGINMRDTVSGVSTLMNMAQHGRFTSRYLSPLFPFTNSIGQTASNLLGALGLHTMTFGNHPQARQLRMKAIRGWAVLFASYASIRALIPLIQDSLGEGEEGERILDMMPLSQVCTFIPVGTGGGAYVKWPTGFGPAMLGALAAYGFDRVERGKMSCGDLMATMMVVFGKSLVPNSMPAFEFKQNPMQFIIQTMSPMIMQPAVQVATGYSYSGAKLSYDSYNRTARQSDHYNLTTDRTWVNIAKGLYDAIGVDMAPEEIRALANGYLGGVLQGVMAWIEHDPLYKNPIYQSTRDQLGPFWSALGATSIYDTGMNVTQTSFYNAREHYENLIRRAGIGNALKGTVGEKKDILLSAGFTQEEADDYISIYVADRQLSDLNSETRKTLDALFGPDMDEDAIRQVYTDWSIARNAVQENTVNGLNYFNRGYRGRFDVPDENASAALRHEVPDAPVIPGNIDLYNRPVVKNADGTISTVATMTEQDVDGLWVNFPSIGPNGERWSPEQAWQHYLLTGEHLGKFRTLEAAEKAAIALHDDQADLYMN